MLNQALAACAEFPNDNPGLHRGAIWLCEEIAAEPVCKRPSAAAAPVVLLEDVEPAAIEVAPAAVLEPTPTQPAELVLDIDEALEGMEAVEVVDELVFDDAIDESPAPVEPVAQENPFATLARVLEEVTRASGGGDDAVAHVRALLGQTRLDGSAASESQQLRAQANAWQAILCGESEDFAACGSAMLDEWSANLVALALGTPTRADGLRRELRRRGIAAFGLIADAA